MSQLWAFLFLPKVLQLDTFEGADFKYDNIILKFQCKNTQIRHFWSQNKGFLSFLPKFSTRHIRVRSFQIWQKYFRIPSPKICRSGICLVPNLRIFIFCTKLCNKANSKALILKITMVFQNCYPKHPNKTFLVPNLRILTFEQNFAIRQIGVRLLQTWQQFFNIPVQGPK